MTMRRALLGCEGCRKVTAHVQAYRVVGKTQASGKVDGHFRLTEAQEVEPIRPHKANAVEILWMCVECDQLRRWGLEVFDGEAGADGVSVRGGAGEGDGEELGEEPLVPEESVEAKAVRVGKRAQVGGA